MRYLILSLAFLSHTLYAAASLMTYVSGEDDGFQIVVANADGTQSRKITSGPLMHVFPFLSFDGEWVAYSEGKDQTHLKVLLKNLKTGVIEEWSSGEGMNLQAALSGNGRWLSYSGNFPGKTLSQIAIIDIEKARKTLTPIEVEIEGQKRLQYPVQPTILEESFGGFFPNLTRDGSAVIYQRIINEKVKDVVWRNIATGEVKVISPAAGYSMAPCLSFDDRYVAYSGRVDGAFDLYVWDRETGDTISLMKDAPRDHEPSFRPDGSMVFASNRIENRFQLFEIPASEMKGGTFAFRPLVTGPGEYFASRFSE